MYNITIYLDDDGIQSVQICQFSTLQFCDLVEIDLANNKINDAGIVWKQVYKKFNKLRTVNFSIFLFYIKTII